MNEDVFKKVLRISEEFFGSATDPEQMPINQSSADKLHSIHADTVVYKFDEENNPIGWVVIVPTSVETMRKFLTKEITERELLDIAVEEKKFEAIYLCGAFVLPEYRRKGYAIELLKEAVRKISDGKHLPLYAWVYSPEGEKLVNVLSKNLHQQIPSRKE